MKLFAAFGSLLLLVSFPASAVSTKIVVRAISRDAKVVGTKVGGARITITDAATGAVLASGMQEGGTGDTRLIMETPRSRDSQVFDTPDSAHYVATIDLDEPRLVTITAEGPLDPPHATVRASKTMLLVPGVDITGDGVLLELHGFRVEILEPTPGVANEGSEIAIRASVTLACGCVTQPGGMWDSDSYDLRAQILDATGEVVAEKRLAYAGEVNIHSTTLTVPAGVATPAKLRVLAIDAGNANFGVATAPLEIRLTQ